MDEDALRNVVGFQNLAFVRFNPYISLFIHQLITQATKLSIATPKHQSSIL